MTFNKLLVIMTDRHIGNLLVSLYAIRRVSESLSKDQPMYCVVDAQLLPLASYLLPGVHFLPFAMRGKKPSPLKKLRLLTRLLGTLRSQKFDVAVDLYGHSESLRIAKWSGAGFIATYGCQPKLIDQYHWSERDCGQQPRHQVDHYLLPFLPVLGHLQPQVLAAPCQPNLMASIKAKLAMLGRQEHRPLALIHPGAGKPYKYWPTGHWQRLIALLEKDQFEVMLLGAGEDQQQIDAILRDKNLAPINAFGHFNLIETIHLGFIARVMIGNDSGPTHLFATTPTEVFSLFGPTDHQLWAPLTDHSHVLRAGIDCLPSCSKQQCQRQTSCLQALLPEEVYGQLMPYLKATPQRIGN